MAEFLLELFCEEIPARMQPRAAQDLERLTCDALKDAGLNVSGVRAFSTPRRIVLLIENLPARQPDREDIRRGPREGAPENAMEGFLRSAGVRRDQLEIEETPKGRFHVAKIFEKGKPSADVIAALMPGIIQNFPWPKSMRWGNGDLRWVRPLHSIICLLEGKVVPFAVGGIRSSNVTCGHRFMAPSPFKVKNFADYNSALAKAFVLLDAQQRQGVILKDTQAQAKEIKAELNDDPALLEEVSGLVEWPIVLIGAFDEAFLSVPSEVLTSTMRTNQKYFSLNDTRSGKLLNRFVVVSNLRARDGGKAIVAGNERVLAARLSDAKFFWDQDRKTSLESRLAKLKDIIFHAKLGTQAERVERLEKLAAAIARRMKVDDGKAAKAARLAKADLVSGTVGEFPEVQGVLGGYLAREEKLGDDIAQAISEHYRPLGPSDVVPSAPLAVAVALADKIDILTGFWAIDEKPTGSKDPYALRRAALGVIRIMLANQLRLPLGHLFADAIACYPAGFSKSFVSGHLVDFFADRLKVHLRDQGARHDLVDAVFYNEAASKGEFDLVAIVTRVQALTDFLKTDNGVNLLAGYRRAANILRIEEKKDGVSYDGGANPLVLHDAEEKILAAAIEKTHVSARAALAREDFEAAMSALSDLRSPLDNFFDKVTVNTQDQGIRANRLRLLSGIRGAVDSIADFSRIEG